MLKNLLDTESSYVQNLQFLVLVGFMLFCALVICNNDNE